MLGFRNSTLGTLARSNFSRNSPSIRSENTWSVISTTSNGVFPFAAMSWARNASEFPPMNFILMPMSSMAGPTSSLNLISQVLGKVAMVISTSSNFFCADASPGAAASASASMAAAGTSAPTQVFRVPRFMGFLP